jgi:hypothetical protein
LPPPLKPAALDRFISSVACKVIEEEQMDNTPAVFIGSSTQGLDFARAVRGLLASDAEITLWNEGFFEIGRTFIESLVNNVERFDFAILVMTPDDLRIKDGQEELQPRDNVVFELGLFMGRLGRARTFVVQQRHADLRLPTDLSGVTTALYDWPRDDKNHKAAVGPASDTIRDAIRQLGLSEFKTQQQIRAVEKRQALQESEINALVFAVKGILTKHETGLLTGLNGPGEVLIRYEPDLYWYLHRLDGLGFIQPNKDNVDGLYGIVKEHRDDERSPYPERHPFNLKKYVYITNEGKKYLNTLNDILRKAEEQMREGSRTGAGS